MMSSTGIKHVPEFSSKRIVIENYDCIGFDLDHTLSKYHLPNLFLDCYTAMSNYLVRKKGYAAEAFQFKENLCLRGTLLDMEHGNFLKLSKNGRILRASHGSRRLSSAEVVAVYGEKRHIEQYHEFIEHVNHIGNRFILFDNLFDLPTANVCAHCIDAIDNKQHVDDDLRPDRYNIWPDVIESINHVYHPKQYAADRGEFFPRWKRCPQRYAARSSDKLKTWLERVKKEWGIKLFLITSSYVDFAKASLQYIFGDDWSTYFDINLTFARKPGFFTQERNFTKLDDGGEEVSVSEFISGQFYLNGNSKDLHKYLSEIIGKENPKVLFVGDSMRSDVFPAKKFAGWDTVLVMEEIECVDAKNCRLLSLGTASSARLNARNGSSSSSLCSTKRPVDELTDDIDCFDGKHAQIDEKPARKFLKTNAQSSDPLDNRSAIVPRAVEDSKASVTGELVTSEKRASLSRDIAFLNPEDWGSLFSDDDEEEEGEDVEEEGRRGRSVETLWSFVINKYADLVIPDIDSITYVPLTCSCISTTVARPTQNNNATD